MGETSDVVIIGSGMGGATLAAGLAASGAEITLLERGEQLPDSPEARDCRAIFQRGFYRPYETWLDGAGAPFNPGNYYFLGGNSKFYGAVMLRYRAEDFAEMEHLGGVSPAWPFGYDELEPWYGAAERLFQVRGAIGDDPTEPPHSSSYVHAPVPDEPDIAEVRSRLRNAGARPFSLPLAVDIDRWLKRAPTPWDAFPDTRSGKLDAETAALATARANPSLRVVTGAEVERLVLASDGRRIEGVEYTLNDERRVIRAGTVVVACGAVNSAALLLRSSEKGVANASGMVGRHFMNHNASAVLAVDPRFVNASVYQKTFGLNDFYLSDGAGGLPLGNVQLLGRISAPILKANIKLAPEWSLGWLSRHAVDFYAMSEDLPDPESRVTIDGRRIRLDWRRSNWDAHVALVDRLKKLMRAAGFPIVLSRAFDRRTPSHQCGTVRIGNDPATAPLDPFGRAFDHPNLFVVDASMLPTSAAVNPALTIAALALRTADHILKTTE